MIHLRSKHNNLWRIRSKTSRFAVVNGFIERRASGKHPLVVDEDEAAAVSSDSEWKLVGSPEGFSDRPMPPGRGNQQQEAAAAGSQELTAQGAGPSRCAVPLVDLVVTDSTAKRSLPCPTLMQ
jgi:hypothetical protein